MRNNALATKAEVDYVCVYALKGETFKTDVKRDGRFSDSIFERSPALSDIDSKTIHQMSEYVDDHNNKKCKVIYDKNKQCQDSQDTSTSDGTMTNAASLDASENTEDEPSQPSVNTEQVNTEQSTSSSRTPIKWKPIEGSKEILKLLCDQFQDLQEQLKHQHLKDTKKFFRAEYDKSVQSLFDVKKVREIMRLCDSVCQIRRQGSARGTGFLLFDRFILTNAHVIEKCNASDFTAVFGYEDLDGIEIKRVKIQNVISLCYGKDDKGNHLDYALLELYSVDEIAGYPELLPYCRQKSLENRSLICIVGHPDGAVKKMDPCFVIGLENRKENEERHISENVQYYHVISVKSMKEKWGFHKNQITYDSCFFHGSSGSPVFDADCKLIGIHTGGYVYKGKGAKTRSVMEYAYAMQPILDNIKARARVKGRQDIVNILESQIRSDASSTAEQQNRTDVDMTDVEQTCNTFQLLSLQGTLVKKT